MGEGAGLVLRGGVVVTMDPQRRVLWEGAVAVAGDRIAAVGPSGEVLAAHPRAEVVDCRGMAILPGLVNAHTHAPMSLMRGLADDLRLDVWLNGYMLPVEREFVDEEFCWWGTLLSCVEMIRSGTTSFCDMYYYEDAVARAAERAGLRALCGETLMKYPTPDAPSYDQSLLYAREFLAKWQGHPRITAAVAPHAPYTCTREILEEATELALAYGAPVLIHLAETAQEVQEAREEFDMSPVGWADRVGVFRARTVAAHCVHTTEEDLDLLAARGVGVAHNPTSNLKLASGIAPLGAMLQRGIAVGLGTDGAGSNNDLDLLEEARLAALLPKGVAGNPTLVPAREALALATIGGARALGLADRIGSLEVGKQADLAVLDLDKPHLTPLFRLSPNNVYSALIYAAKGGDVRHVLVDGRWLMRDGEILSLDVSQVMRTAREIATRENEFLSQREQSLLDKLLAIGGLERKETFEVQIKVRIPDRSVVEARLRVEPEFEIVKHTLREQYDTYFLFDDPQKGRIRYREDNVVVTESEDEWIWGRELPVRPIYTLTLMGPAVEREYENLVILSRSRFTCEAPHSLRFYREYFAPDREKEVVKWRRRFRVRFRGVDFALNLDRLRQPPREGTFLEVKSRTWSQADALRKAELISEMLRVLRVEPAEVVKEEYVQF
ncbi:MAG: amidohydrolase family protein [Anaerolineae bacterium]